VSPPAPDPVAGSVVEPVPEVAAAVFGARLALAERYAELLCTVGVERGLIGPREPSRIWDRHLLNCAALAGAVPEDADVVDVGAGAGLPGIPVALARPSIRLTLVEPMQRRAEFLREVVAALALDADVVCGRAEDLPRPSADVVVVRAVATLSRLLPLTLPLLRPAGRLLALKGRSASAEIEKATPIIRKWRAAHVSVGTVEYAGAAAGVVRVDMDRAASSSTKRR
jgi:16S rRNA (guanine527-N7)-methyltransferase